MATIGGAIAFTRTASAAGSVVYSATKTIPVPPASNFAGSGGGDGWGLAFDNAHVYNVFHHNAVLDVACHNQADATPCYPVRQIQQIVDNVPRDFATSSHPGLYMAGGGKLYVYATRTDSTPGVVCIDTTVAASNPNPSCGFTALGAIGEGAGSVSDMMVVGTKLYAFNYYSGQTVVGAKNKVLCFDTATSTPCAGQPFALFSSGTDSDNNFPTPGVAQIGGRLIVTADMGLGAQVACFDPAAGAACAGAWPATVGGATSGDAPFPSLTPAGAVQGVCVRGGGTACLTLNGAPAATPAGLFASFSSSGWIGPAAIVGTRAYLAQSDNLVTCYDFSTSAQCPNFPHSTPNASFLYTVTQDPQRPTCLWVNSDNGSAQIQNFDAFTGGACGSGDIRILASQFVVPTVLCQPSVYNSLQLVDPARGSYATGTVAFQDGGGNPIPGVSDQPIDATGSVDLSHLSLNTASGLPQFLIHLTGVTAPVGQVTAKLTWTGTDDPSCAPAGVPQTAKVRLSASAVDFGAVAVGTSATRTVTVSNTGTSPLTVASLAVSGANGSDFSSTGCSSPVAVGGSCDLTLRFAPTAGGARSGTVTVTSNAVNSPNAISLSGSGYYLHASAYGGMSNVNGGVASLWPAAFGQHLAPTPAVMAPTGGGSATQTAARVFTNPNNYLNMFDVTATATATAGGSPTLSALVTTGSVNIRDEVFANATSSRCSANSTSASGNSTTDTLLVDGVPYALISPIPPNKLFQTTSGRLVVNEQIHNTDGTVTINALHMYVDNWLYGKGDIVVGHVNCGINTAP